MVFGTELYPTIPQKAAALGWNIIKKHIFYDGNKRTGLFSCITFLELNGYKLEIAQDGIDEEVITITEGIANNIVSLEDFTQWVEERIQPLSNP